MNTNPHGSGNSPAGVPSGPSVPNSVPATAASPAQGTAPATNPDPRATEIINRRDVLSQRLAQRKLIFQAVDYASRGYHLDAVVGPEQVVEAAMALDQEGFALDTITGVDWLAQNQMEVVYDYYHPQNGLRAVVRTRIARDNPVLATISAVFPGANWHERETHDFFGISFSGHPDLSPFLLPEDATYHPLKKDFTTC